MSGHITRMSRGSSVGSSESRPSTTSRSTSTWRDGPWQACTCTLRSPGSRTRVAGSTVALAAMSCCSQESRSVVAVALADGRRSLLDHRRRDHRRQGALAARARHVRARRAAGGRPARARRPRCAARTAARSSSASQSAGGRVRQPHVHVAVLAERAEQLDLGRPGCGCGRTARTAPAGRSPRGRVPQRREHAEVTLAWARARRPARRAVARARAARPGRGRGRRRLRRCRRPTPSR